MSPTRTSRRLSVLKHLPLLDTSPSPLLTHLPFAPRSSHTRNRKEGHIPRPPNAFMVFRSWLWNKDNLKSIERDNRNVSRIAGRYWNGLSEAERAPFRLMAEQAKARHAQLYPQYRYSPTSQKKTKVTQRRTQRAVGMENEKCDKVVDMLLAGIHVRPSSAVDDQIHAPEETRSLKRPAQPRSKKVKTPSPSPLPVLPVFGQSSEIAPIPGPVTRTPEFVYLLDKFVPTDQIPHLSLDACNDFILKPSEDDHLSALFPSHMNPATHTIFSGVKPEATSFVDSYMFGTYNTDAFVQHAPLPFPSFDMDPFAALNPSFLPLSSPIFSNPFEPSMQTAEHSVLLDSLDQLFGQPISPLGTTFFPAENW